MQFFARDGASATASAGDWYPTVDGVRTLVADGGSGFRIADFVDEPARATVGLFAGLRRR